jgi:hypothetical protein
MYCTPYSLATIVVMRPINTCDILSSRELSAREAAHSQQLLFRWSILACQTASASCDDRCSALNYLRDPSVPCRRASGPRMHILGFFSSEFKFL